MKEILHKWKKLMEAGVYGKDITQHGDGEHPDFIAFSEGFTGALRKYVLHSSREAKAALLPFLEELYSDMQERGTDIRPYLKQLMPDGPTAYRGRVGIPVDEIKSMGFALPKNPVTGEFYLLKSGTYKARERDITSWSYNPGIAAMFASQEISEDGINNAINRGTPFCNAIMEARTKSAGFILNTNTAEREVLFIGNEVPINRMLVLYIDPQNPPEGQEIVDAWDKPFHNVDAWSRAADKAFGY